MVAAAVLGHIWGMSTNVDTVRRIYAAFARQDAAALLEPLAEDVAWDTALVEGGAPWLQPRRGRTGVRAFLEALQGMDLQRFDVKAILGDGDVVVAVIDLEAVVRATGWRVVEVDEAHIWTFDRGGRVVRFRHGADTLAHARASDGG